MKFLLLILFCCFAENAFAQHWTRIGKLDPYPSAGYFRDAEHGVVACIGDNFDANNAYHYSNTIYVTSNGGKNWIKAQLPQEVTAWEGRITSIFMDSPAHGYFTLFATGFSSYKSPGVYETFNGGLSWSVLSGSLQWNNLLVTPTSRVVFSNGGISLLDDSTIVVTTAVQPLVSNTAFGFAQTYKSSDSGESWIQSGPTGEAYGLAYLPRWHSLLFYPDIRTNSPSWVSKDNGLNWAAAAAIAGAQGPAKDSYTTGDCEGAGDAFYVQSCAAFGLFRSTDFGNSWKSIGGPSNGLDTRFCVVQNCSGGTVIAFDRDGSIWETTDGGDGLLPETHEGGSGTLSVGQFPQVSACSSSRTLGALFSNGCLNGLTVSTIELLGDTSHFSLVNPPSLPISFGGGTSDSFYVQFHPDHQVGDFTIRLHIHGKVSQRDGAFDKPLDYDTVVTLTASSKPDAPRLTTSVSSIDFGSVSTCLTGRDTVVTLTNYGCAPDTITSLDLSGTGFSISANQLPIILQPDSSYQLTVHFEPNSASSYASNLDVHYRSQSIGAETGFSFSGVGQSGSATLTLANTSYEFGSFTVCSTDSTITGTIANTGCDTLVLHVPVASGAGYDIAANAADTLLPPNGRATYTIRFHPGTKGFANGSLHLKGTSLHSGTNLDTVISLGANVLDGTRLLNASASSLDLGTTSICQNLDSAVSLTNTGCDTVWVTDATFSNASFIVTSTLPIRLLPNESKSVKFASKIDTTGHPNNLVSTLSIVSTSDQPVQPILVTQSLSFPAKFSLALVDRAGGTNTKQQAGNNSPVSFTIEGIGTITPQVTSLDVTLVYNDDLLSFESVAESTVSIVSSTRRGDGLTERVLHISSLPSGIHSGVVLATLRFIAKLSKDSSTSIALQNILVNGLTLKDAQCVASVDATGGGFEYVYTCGEGLISSFLRGGALIVTGEPPYPNPLTPDAGFKTVVPFTTTTSGVARLRLYDAQGIERHTERMQVYSAGRHYFYLSSANLASGRYEYVIEFPDGHPAVRRAIVVEK